MWFQPRQSAGTPRTDVPGTGGGTTSPSSPDLTGAGGAAAGVPTFGGGLTDRDIALIRTSLAVVEPLAADMAVYFYSILFTRYPQVREMFPPGMDAQRGRLLRALLHIVDLVDDPEGLQHFCAHLGRDHRKFGTENAHYDAVGACLLAALERFAGPAWNAEVAQAWTRAYTAVAQTMTQAADEDARTRPARWHARIVHRQAFSDSIAAITVQPDTPYEYAAGQYVSMETPWWPREWRYYSPANAPRPDGTITFHVRAVPAGWVSNALVRRSNVGDVIRLGPPLGDMVLDPASGRDILCVAGGTGLAPIRALVEESARSGHERQMDVFIGARTANELYGLDEMLRFSQRNHWLRVRAAVSDEDILGLSGSLPQVLQEFGPWYRHDAYLSGPASMVTATADTLTRTGVPRSRIRHDPLDVPVLSPN
ncbi:globin domain-containing protein [Streptacidiphilus neutrinimicus]|uniref:globin domain-containing protein n=1 Tax=Streptacidiphilus neutrinimicus TaxID=105420 RepID=UPI000A458D3A|nr:globin domain-containing protein [Streptacidiphilus neutrinimicus]